MFRILAAKQLAPDVKWFRIEAPLIARPRRAGQFVILRLDETGERVPMTIADADPQAGAIELLVKAVGKTTMVLCAKTAGDTIADIVGPLGRPTDIEKVGHAVVVGGGVGTAVVYPLAQALQKAGNYVSAITGGLTAERVMLEKELWHVADIVYPCTDDGSHGFHGNVAHKLAELILDRERPIGAVYTAGPVPMMRAVADLTRPHRIKTTVSLNPLMIDGTGMCGGCRVTVDGQIRFACVDGPEFDGHLVNFDELVDRLTTYKSQERISREYLEHECQLEKTS
ncbi:MAG: sulfide/dihydroorotate dehydrogenase-like FAD/NAD-binding protein [Planctomycetes bacterium]|nr:sulfide/dihydroorotate dehydrogenase-like FAD/NAD-binding protein [Planctomycetota bacterium]